MIADNVVYLVITEKSYPRKLAFSYLDELHKEFQNSYGSQVETVRKPYAFVKFGALCILLIFPPFTFADGPVSQTLSC